MLRTDKFVYSIYVKKTRKKT